MNYLDSVEQLYHTAFITSSMLMSISHNISLSLSLSLDVSHLFYEILSNFTVTVSIADSLQSHPPPINQTIMLCWLPCMCVCVCVHVRCVRMCLSYPSNIISYTDISCPPFYPTLNTHFHYKENIVLFNNTIPLYATFSERFGSKYYSVRNESNRKKTR